MPQRELLALLKLPDTAALVKLFRKIPPESIDPRLWTLLSVLRQPDGTCLKLLAHVPLINLGVMELILPSQIRNAVTPTLLEAVAVDPKEKYRRAVAAMSVSPRASAVGKASVATNTQLGSRHVTHTPHRQREGPHRPGI